MSAGNPDQKVYVYAVFSSLRNDSDFGPKVRVTGQKSELQAKSQSYRRADPQNPNRIARKKAPESGFGASAETPPP